MAVKDFIICFFADSPLLDKALSSLTKDYILFTPPVMGRKYKEFVQSAGGSVMGIWNKARRQGDEIGRVALMGFSEGCQGVSAVLETPDASAIDVVFPVDGIHRQFSDPLGKIINPVALSNYIAFARLAATAPPSGAPDTKLMVITHSSIGSASLPPGMASTTQTAEVIWKEALSPPPASVEDSGCGWPCPSAEHESTLELIRWPNADLPLGTKLPGGSSITAAGWTTVRPSAAETGFIPSATFSWSGFADGWNVRRVANNLYINGWSYDTKNRTKDPTGNRDHVFQAQMVLPHIAKEFLVKRWNPSCDAMGSLGDGSCSTTGSGKGYSQQAQIPLPNPYPLGVAIPSIPSNCPQPPPGKIIIGRPGDPCWYGGDLSSDLTARLILGLGVSFTAAAAGYYGTKYLMKSMRPRSR